MNEHNVQVHAQAIGLDVSLGPRPPHVWRQLLETDVPRVLQIESCIYDFPWTEGNFKDSIAQGYIAYGLWSDIDTAHSQLMAYVVMMRVLDEFHLLNLSVAPEHHRQGLATSILNWIFAYALQQKANGMLLEVRPSNAAAKALYEGLGFEWIGVRRHYYPAKVGREDALVMAKRLNHSTRGGAT